MVEQRKPINWKVAAIFAAGLLLGGGVAVWAMLRLQAPDRPAVQAGAPAERTVKASAAPPAAYAHVACPAGLVIASSSNEDGKARLQVEPKTSSDIAALILFGKESAAAGRLRDAEISFQAACQASDKLQRADAPEPADTRYQLARHYAHVVQVSDLSLPNRAELIRRADLLYSDAVQAYRVRHGESHEKTRFAAEGLAALRQSFAQAAPTVALPAQPVQKPAPASAATPAPRAVAAAEPAPPAPVRAARPVDLPRPAIAAAPARPRTRPAWVEVENGPVRQATGAPNQGTPSFDCGLARSPAERRICSDAELSRLDRELGRLHARARNSAPDGAAFRRQNDREWRRREATCGGDRECLLDWYAQRRDQLLDRLDNNQQ